MHMVERVSDPGALPPPPPPVNPRISGVVDGLRDHQAALFNPGGEVSRSSVVALLFAGLAKLAIFSIVLSLPVCPLYDHHRYTHSFKHHRPA